MATWRFGEQRTLTDPLILARVYQSFGANGIVTIFDELGGCPIGDDDQDQTEPCEEITGWQVLYGSPPMVVASAGSTTDNYTDHSLPGGGTLRVRHVC